MLSQFIFLVTLVAGCFSNSIIEANETLIDVPNLWMLEINAENIKSAVQLSSKRVVHSKGKLWLELQYGRLTPINVMPIGNNEVIDRNVKKYFDIFLRVPLYPQFRIVYEEEDVVNNGKFDHIQYLHLERIDNDVVVPYLPVNFNSSRLPLWEMDFNKKWAYGFDGTVYGLLFSIRKV